MTPNSHIRARAKWVFPVGFALEVAHLELREARLDAGDGIGCKPLIERPIHATRLDCDRRIEADHRVGGLRVHIIRTTYGANTQQRGIADPTLVLRVDVTINE